MAVAYVFDVDGTLTPSRQPMDKDFQKDFLDIVRRRLVILATGSDQSKTIEQVGFDIFNEANAVYCCAGNHLSIKGETIRVRPFKMSDDLELALERELFISSYGVRTGNHIEKRLGSANFSIVGRNANPEEREDYRLWDVSSGERLDIIHRLSQEFSEYDFRVGGVTGIDITHKGFGKEQIANDLHSLGIKYAFYGDATFDMGNDQVIASLATLGSYTVRDWQETRNILKEHGL